MPATLTRSTGYEIEQPSPAQRAARERFHAYMRAFPWRDGIEALDLLDGARAYAGFAPRPPKARAS